MREGKVKFLYHPSFFLETDLAESTLKDRVIEALTKEVAPALELDGSGIEVVDVTDGIVQVRLHNVCNGCPSTIMTVIMGIEQELRNRVPEVEYLEAVY